MGCLSSFSPFSHLLDGVALCAALSEKLLALLDVTHNYGWKKREKEEEREEVVGERVKRKLLKKKGAKDTTQESY